MFTGIVHGAYPVVGVERGASALQLSIQLDAELAAGLEVGASVAVAGVCLTVTRLQATRSQVLGLPGPVVSFDLVQETLQRTRLSAVTVGSQLNIERALRASDELGGHWVSGHVWGTGRVHAVNVEGLAHTLWLDVPSEWVKFLHPKGFVALDGCSLTLDQVLPEGRLSVHLIPETLRRTTLGEAAPGGLLNVELDSNTVAIVRSVERVLGLVAQSESQP